MNLDVSKGGFDELAKFDARPTNYVTMAAHEIRSPLRSLRIYLETIKADYGTHLDKPANELVNKSLHAVEQMQRLLEGILDCARMEHSTAPKRFIRMNETLKSVLVNLQDEVDRTKATISISDLPVVRYNREQLETVLTNLIRNSIQYCGNAPPHIEVSSVRLDHAYEIVVKDQGIGISPEHQKIIFEPFSQIEKAGHGTQTGLGLYICKSIVEQNGGRLSVNSIAGHGAEFRFSIQEVDNERT